MNFVYLNRKCSSKRIKKNASELCEGTGSFQFKKYVQHYKLKKTATWSSKLCVSDSSIASSPGRCAWTMGSRRTSSCSTDTRPATYGSSGVPRDAQPNGTFSGTRCTATDCRCRTPTVGSLCWAVSCVCCDFRLRTTWSMVTPWRSTRDDFSCSDQTVCRIFRPLHSTYLV